VTFHLEFCCEEEVVLSLFHFDVNVFWKTFCSVLFFVLVSVRIELRALAIAGQALYQLSPTRSPFAFSLSFRWGLLLFPGLTPISAF
jgi:hypothetical protein